MAEESTASLVEYACKDQVATLTLNRPQRLNAFNDELVRHLADVLYLSEDFQEAARAFAEKRKPGPFKGR
jgi:enoyl-CoA hydratase/carnithine racemase